jgi:hypothetical protein
VSRTWALMERVDVPDASKRPQRHMIRWRLIQTPWFAVYLHKLFTSDEARPTPHTHPWPFVSLILRGGYTEDFERRDKTGRLLWSTYKRSWRAGSVHYLRATDAHWIRSLHRVPTWTLIVTGRRHSEPSWGYWEDGEYTPAEEHRHQADFETAMAEWKAVSDQ